jgi:hypothetical protein
LRTPCRRVAFPCAFLCNTPPFSTLWLQSIIALQERSDRTTSFTAGTTSSAKISA